MRDVGLGPDYPIIVPNGQQDEMWERSRWERPARWMAMVEVVVRSPGGKGYSSYYFPACWLPWNVRRT